jgi:membrane dipeptidase
MLIVDAHQDLAWNMLTFGRDYTRSASETRRLETGSVVPQLNGDTLLGWPDYKRGSVALIFSTLFAAPERYCKGEWELLCYTDQSSAARLYGSQLDAYDRLVSDHPEMFRLVLTQADLDGVLSGWRDLPDAETGSSRLPDEQSAGPIVGLVILMEGAEAVWQPSEMEDWWGRGVRLVGPAWAGTRFCGGTNEPGPLTREGFAFLAATAEFGFGLDLSHMDEQAALQALDTYPGQVLASHSNASSLLKGLESNRHLSDRLIRGLVEREAVIGVVPYNVFLKEGWKRGDSRQDVSLRNLVEHIDHICQIAGDAKHIGIGSDFDGGFGVQCTPQEIDSIADLQRLTPLLNERGYSQAEQADILANNWLNCLRKILPVG